MVERKAKQGWLWWQQFPHFKYLHDFNGLLLCLPVRLPSTYPRPRFLNKNCYTQLLMSKLTGLNCLCGTTHNWTTFLDSNSLFSIFQRLLNVLRRWKSSGASVVRVTGTRSRWRRIGNSEGVENLSNTFAHIASSRRTSSSGWKVTCTTHMVLSRWLSDEIFHSGFQFCQPMTSTKRTANVADYSNITVLF